jgi:hypothetical protein
VTISIIFTCWTVEVSFFVIIKGRKLSLIIPPGHLHFMPARHSRLDQHFKWPNRERKCNRYRFTARSNNNKSSPCGCWRQLITRMFDLQSEGISEGQTNIYFFKAHGKMFFSFLLSNPRGEGLKSILRHRQAAQLKASLERIQDF